MTIACNISCSPTVAPLLTLSLYYPYCRWMYGGRQEEEVQPTPGKAVFVRALVILNFDFLFLHQTYIGSKYRLSVCLVCKNRYRHRPWKTHIGRPLLLATQAWFCVMLHFKICEIIICNQRITHYTTSPRDLKRRYCRVNGLLLWSVFLFWSRTVLAEQLFFYFYNFYS